MSQPFGLLIPGAPVRTDFVASDPSSSLFALALSGITGRDISAVSELVFFLLPGISLPKDTGAMLFWQIISVPASNNMTSTPFAPPSMTTEFELIGAITNDRPSGSFRTGWATNEALSTAMSSSNVVTINLGVSIEPISQIRNVGVSIDNTANVAQFIAKDLFNFMSSFDNGTGGAGNMVVPRNIFDRWMNRFEARSRADPHFYLKKADD